MKARPASSRSATAAPPAKTPRTSCSPRRAPRMDDRHHRDIGNRHQRLVPFDRAHRERWRRSRCRPRSRSARRRSRSRSQSAKVTSPGRIMTRHGPGVSSSAEAGRAIGREVAVDPPALDRFDQGRRLSGARASVRASARHRRSPAVRAASTPRAIASAAAPVARRLGRQQQAVGIEITAQAHKSAPATPSAHRPRRSLDRPSSMTSSRRDFLRREPQPLADHGGIGLGRDRIDARAAQWIGLVLARDQRPKTGRAVAFGQPVIEDRGFAHRIDLCRPAPVRRAGAGIPCAPVRPRVRAGRRHCGGRPSKPAASNGGRP